MTIKLLTDEELSEVLQAFYKQMISEGFSKEYTGKMMGSVVAALYRLEALK